MPDVSWGAVSLQLKALTQAGLLESRISGRNRFYRADRVRLAGVAEMLERMWSDALWRLRSAAEFGQPSRAAAAPAPETLTQYDPKERTGTMTLPHRLDRSMTIQAPRDLVFVFSPTARAGPRGGVKDRRIIPRVGGAVYIRHPGNVEVRGEIVSLDEPASLTFTYGDCCRQALPARRLPRHDRARVARRRHAPAPHSRVSGCRLARPSRAGLALSTVGVQQHRAQPAPCGRRIARGRLVRPLVGAGRVCPFADARVDRVGFGGLPRSIQRAGRRRRRLGAHRRRATLHAAQSAKAWADPLIVRARSLPIGMRSPRTERRVAPVPTSSRSAPTGVSARQSGSGARKGPLPTKTSSIDPRRQEHALPGRAVRHRRRRRDIRMGRVSSTERRLIVILLLVMAGWIASPLHGLPNAIVALFGVSALLITAVISWEELLGERKAWEALIWFGALVMMADSLLQLGVVNVLAQGAFHYVQGLSGLVAIILLVTLYLYIHYGFASMTAQVTALYPSFLTAALTIGINPFVSALSLAYFSNLNAAMTHYGTGSAPVYFGVGYVSQGAWWKVGFLISLVNLAIWLGLGLLWWKLLGWW